MHNHDPTFNGLEDSLKQTIKTSDLSSFASSTSEFTIDFFLEKGVLRDIPIVNSLSGLWKAGVSVKDYYFTKKIVRFLSELSKIPDQERSEMINSLEASKQIYNTGELILSLMEKIDSAEKAKFSGIVFKYYASKKIDINELLRLIHVVENVPYHDIVALKDWDNTKINSIDKVRKSIYVSVGLIWYVLDASSNGFNWESRLCGVIAKIIDEMEMA